MDRKQSERQKIQMGLVKHCSFAEPEDPTAAGNIDHFGESWLHCNGQAGQKLEWADAFRTVSLVWEEQWACKAAAAAADADNQLVDIVAGIAAVGGRAVGTVGCIAVVATVGLMGTGRTSESAVHEALDSVSRLDKHMVLRKFALVAPGFAVHGAGRHILSPLEDSASVV